MDVVERWTAGGMGFLTGLPTDPIDFSRAALLDEAERLAAPFDVDANTLLTGRAALSGLRGRGRISAGGATRLLRAADGWLAITLARPNDIHSVPAVLADESAAVDPWHALEAAARIRPASDIAGRAQLFDIPAAELSSVAPETPTIRTTWPRANHTPIDHNLLVVDLSAMWAGPLCGMLLRGLGATVIKVESHDRPDGARSGNPDFFRWLNGSKYHCQFTFAGDNGPLARLLDVADVVIEASRPRALRQFGLDAERRAPRAGRVWVRISGYGSRFENRVAFGDDAAVAGGLVGQSPRGPVFCGDAIADPLTGITAANEVLSSLQRGGGEVIDVSMAAVAARFAALPIVAQPMEVPGARAPSPPEILPSFAQLDNMWLQEVVRKRLAGEC
ncbi:CoA transferase [Rhodococcus koreensis]